MKLFEEFENDLRDVNSLKGLAKIMLANGVKSVDVDDFEICVNVRGLIENVPQELWRVQDENVFSVAIVANYNGFKIFCFVTDKEAFTERTGFKFPEVEE